MRLVIANLNYSSWSIRAWLALRLANIQFSTHDVGLKCHPDWKNRILQFSGAGKVPVLIDGPLSIHESLAICEYANEIAPTAKLWPDDRALRARGRAISCEMASSFATLRQLMPCNIRGRSKATPHTAQLEQELARLMDIWDASLATSAGGYLLGDHMTIADCMYTPVLFRMRTYGVPLSQRIQGYSDLILNHPLILELEQLAAATEAIAEYDAHLVE
jgi:glutathione S-transferase